MNAQTKIEPAMSVYAKIAAVQGELAKVGIGKNSENSAQNYKFRGIDAVYNALSPLLSKHGLCILPRMLSRERQERVSVKEYQGNKRESVLFYVTVEAEFDFVSSDDGSLHTVRTYGEAMDSGDKATNKAMSAAYKYAAFMAFAIPTEGDNDADATTHEVTAPAAEEMPDAEWAKLAGLLKATKMPAAKLIKEYGVENLRCLNQDQYVNAIERLNNRLAAMAKAETNAKQDALAKEPPREFADVEASDVPF